MTDKKKAPTYVYEHIPTGRYIRAVSPPAVLSHVAKQDVRRVTFDEALELGRNNTVIEIAGSKE